MACSVRDLYDRDKNKSSVSIPLTSRLTLLVSTDNRPQFYFPGKQFGNCLPETLQRYFTVFRKLRSYPPSATSNHPPYDTSISSNTVDTTFYDASNHRPDTTITSNAGITVVNELSTVRKRSLRKDQTESVTLTISPPSSSLSSSSSSTITSTTTTATTSTTNRSTTRTNQDDEHHEQGKRKKRSKQE